MVTKHSYASIIQRVTKNGKGSLAPAAKTLIEDLLAKVMKPGYTRSPHFNRGRKGGTRYQESMPKYEPKPKVKKGEEQMNLDELRKLFNKLTGSKYEAQLPKLVQHLGRMEKAASFNTTAVIGALFTVVENTPFYSRMYAKAYAVLCKHHPFLTTEVKARREAITKSMESIGTADPNTDYDAFCELNKQNSRRQAMAKFLIALSEEGLLGPDDALSLIDETISLFIRMAGEEGQKEEAGTVADLLGSMVIDNVFTAGLITKYHPSRMESIEDIASWKAAERPSATNKAIFKFMDIRDYLRTYER